ncbi:8109_t:CDS:10 [Ambispora gerdemannii]|uniref:8109_t:CDS:1 n=1 Tax=Ambispora gerdemannii TaxID=144530 RepID=A0A9N8YM56_9GLOM|nr:8109_t:CDS:10 [Ambispora gerdemannii]
MADNSTTLSVNTQPAQTTIPITSVISPSSPAPGPTLSTASLTQTAPLPRRHSIYGTGEDRIVLDVGSLYIKAGFSGESRPRHVVPIFAGNMKAHWEPDLTGSGGSRRDCGEGCRIIGGFSELFDLSIGRTSEELESLYDRMAHYLHDIYFRYLLTDPKQRKVVLCESPMMPLKLKQLIAKVLFENLQVPSISFAPSHMLALLTTGCTTGLVVDCGHLETTVMPTFSARPLNPFIRTTPLAGRALTQRLKKLISEFGKIIVPPSTNRQPIHLKYLTPTVLEDIKTRFLYVGPMIIPSTSSIVSAEKTPEEDFEKKYASISSATEIYYPITLSKHGRERQMGTLVLPGWIRERAAEVLFEGDEDESSIVGCLLECLLKTPIHLRQPLAASILLIGGTTLLPNFQPRLHQEILRALSTDNRFQNLNGLNNHIAFLEEKSNGKVFVANCRAWVGGSLIGSLKSTVVEITREKYSGKVPDWTTESIARSKPNPGKVIYDVVHVWFLISPPNHLSRSLLWEVTFIFYRISQLQKVPSPIFPTPTSPLPSFREASFHKASPPLKRNEPHYKKTPKQRVFNEVNPVIRKSVGFRLVRLPQQFCEARDQFDRGFESEAFHRLEEIVKTIDVLKDFKAKCADLHLPTSMIPPVSHPPPNTIAVAPTTVTAAKSNKRSVATKNDKPRKQIKTTVDDTPTITSEMYPVNYTTNDLSRASQSTITTPNPVVIPSTPRTHTHAPLDPELIRRLDAIFLNFLQNICSDLNAMDSKGEQIHQTLMAKKMQKLDESPDFRPFKFRIQAFTNAFYEELMRSGFNEEMLPLRKVKNYLWTQRYISRFNEDGKKAKSKGNHVWNIEAKKIPTGGWIFREFTRKIAGIPDKIAYIGLRYNYAPRVWDPQVNVKSIKAVFHSPVLPDWLNWENNVLTGTPGLDSQSCEVTAIANYYHGDTVYKLEKTFVIQVAHLDTSQEHEMNQIVNPVAMADYQLQPHLEDGPIAVVEQPQINPYISSNNNSNIDRKENEENLAKSYYN